MISTAPAIQVRHHGVFELEAFAKDELAEIGTRIEGGSAVVSSEAVRVAESLEPVDQQVVGAVVACPGGRDPLVPRSVDAWHI
jgi:hypothetical protein